MIFWAQEVIGSQQSLEALVRVEIWREQHTPYVFGDALGHLVDSPSSPEEFPLELVNKETEPEDVGVTVNQIGVGNILSKVLNHCPFHVGASIPEEVRGDDPELDV